MITDPACFLENNILKQYFIKSAFCEKTTTGGELKYSSLKDVVVLNSVFPGVFLQKIFLENYRSYNTSPGFGDSFIVIIIIIIKFAHHIKKSRQHVM